MKGYHLRSRSVPRKHTRTLGDVPSSSASHATTEGLVDGLVSVGQCLVSAGRPRAGVPSPGTQEHQATSDRIGAALRALLTNLPQEVPDDRSKGDQAEILDPEAEAYANVEASISLPDLALGVAANVGAPISPASWTWLPPLTSGQPHRPE